MTKSDLKTGMVVTVRDGKEYVVFKDSSSKDYGTEDLIVNGLGRNWTGLRSYNEDFSRNDAYNNLDIVKVEQANHPYSFMDLEYEKKSRKTLWERKEPRTVTMEEVNAKFGEEVRIAEKK